MVAARPVYLSSLRTCPTRFRHPQAKLLEFLALIHEESAKISGDTSPVGKLLMRYGVKDSSISSRGFEVEDYFLPPEQRKICQPTPLSAGGASMQERMKLFSARANEVFDFFYDENSPAPEHIIHVTCTGYISPSAPQQLVARRHWSTEVTHAYHMGCYASLPSIRLAMGQVLGLGKTVDIVHTEMCSVHVNPSLQTPEQMVVQSLFGDGHVAYQLGLEKKGPSLKVIHIKEKVLPETKDDITWIPSSHGMSMSLSREVPNRIRDHIRTFVSDLCGEANLSLSSVLSNAIFAIHPGGPKIVETISEVLELRDSQTSSSKKVLFENGNMSSATLPFIWQRISSSDLPSGTPIVSLAFGPGLTIFGAIFEVA